MKTVYVLIEEGSWDYEPTMSVEVYSTFEKALKEFNNRVALAKQDMDEWTEDSTCEQNIDEASESASFEIYEDGNFTRLHDTIVIEKKEVK